MPVAKEVEEEKVVHVLVYGRLVVAEFMEDLSDNLYVGELTG